MLGTKGEEVKVSRIQEMRRDIDLANHRPSRKFKSHFINKVLRFNRMTALDINLPKGACVSFSAHMRTRVFNLIFNGMDGPLPVTHQCA